jgi:hypothetical protein
MVLTGAYTGWCNVGMELRDYLRSLPSDIERAAFATRCGTTLGHLRNVGYGYKPCATDLAVRIESETAGSVSRPELREDWAAHWPELIQAKGPDPRRPKAEKAGA